MSYGVNIWVQKTSQDITGRTVESTRINCALRHNLADVFLIPLALVMSSHSKHQKAGDHSHVVKHASKVNYAVFVITSFQGVVFNETLEVSVSKLRPTSKEQVLMCCSCPIFRSKNNLMCLCKGCFNDRDVHWRILAVNLSKESFPDTWADIPYYWAYLSSCQFLNIRNRKIFLIPKPVSLFFFFFPKITSAWNVNQATFSFAVITAW